MKFLPLLGKLLKDEEVVDLLECDDVTVIYDFDRTHENIPDLFWAPAQQKGYQLRFDGEQRLDVIFLYAQSLEGFTAIERSGVEDISFFASAAEVEAHGVSSRLSVTRGGRDDGPPPSKHWIRIDLPDRAIHYDFRSAQLAIVTISARSRT